MCEVNITLERQIPTQRWLVVIESCLPSPHCLVAQDVALSRPKRGFEFLWGHKNSTILFKTRIPGRGFYSYSSGGTKLTIVFKTRIPGRGFIRTPLEDPQVFMILGHLTNVFKTRIPGRGILFEFLWGHFLTFTRRPLLFFSISIHEMRCSV